jgi:biopolymer transport protein ExbD/biopolymer transport protein TolR
MTAAAKKPRFFLPSQSVPQGEINVTPLVDVVLVLLIIFMVVTPLLEKDLPVSLPSMEKVEDIREVPPDQLVVNLSDSGEIKVNGDVVSAAEYGTVLGNKLKNKSAADKIVFFVASDRANYGQLVSLLDAAKRAGATTMGMAPSTPEGESADPGQAPAAAPAAPSP